MDIRATEIFVVVALVIVLLLVYVKYNPNYTNHNFHRNQQINLTKKWLYKCVNDVCNHCNMNPLYEIKENSVITYTEKLTSSHSIKGTINLVIWDEKTQNLFNRNTLVYAVLHEISHILSPSTDHNPPFDSIESTLLKKAQELSYYDPKIPIEPNYITLDIGHTTK